MKYSNYLQKSRYITALVCCAIAFLMVSCDNDGEGLLSEFESPGKLAHEIDGEIDFDYIAGLASGDVLHGYSYSHGEHYARYASSDWKWKENTNLTGYMPMTPHDFIIGRGKFYMPFDMWSPPFPMHPLSMPWSAYQRATGKILKLYLETPFVVSAEGRTIEIDEMTFKIERFTQRGVILSAVGEFIEPVGEHLDITSYTVSDVTFDFDEICLSFTSETDMFRTVIAMLREQFGETINFDDWFDRDYGQPIVNISDLESQLGLK